MKNILKKMKHLHLSVLSFLLLIPVTHAEEYTCKVTVRNDSDRDKKDAPVVLSLTDLPVAFPVVSAWVTSDQGEIPSQLDDLDKDSQPDELSFVLDIPASSSAVLNITLSSDKVGKEYPARVYAEMLLSGKKGKHQPITSLTVPGSSDIYDLLHHHGPAFESELVAYRIYFDKKQTVDIYGKFHKRLEIEESQFYPTDEQLARGFGDDVLRIGGSGGLGALKGWDGQKAVHIEPIDTRTESVLATGPVRTVVDVSVKDWVYQGAMLNMHIRYILYAGHRDCEVQVRWDKPLSKEVFCAGVQNILGSVLYSDQKGLLACWGTDWPVNDTVKYAKETVGLAISLPENIVKEQVQDKVNYLYTISAPAQSHFTYYINFTSKKETFGYQDAEAWFNYVQQWKKELNSPVQIRVE